MKYLIHIADFESRSIEEHIIDYRDDTESIGCLLALYNWVKSEVSIYFYKPSPEKAAFCARQIDIFIEEDESCESIM